MMLPDWYLWPVMLGLLALGAVLLGAGARRTVYWTVMITAAAAPFTYALIVGVSAAALFDVFFVCFVAVVLPWAAARR